MLSTVNPCGFALLPAFLAYNLGSDNAHRPRDTLLGCRPTSPQRTGDPRPWSVSASPASSPSPDCSSPSGLHAHRCRPLGRGHHRHRPRRPRGSHSRWTSHWAHGAQQEDPGSNTRRGPAGMLAFGAAYAIASLSCTLAVLLAVIAQALAASSLTTLVAVFAAYAAGASTVLVLLALSTALRQFSPGHGTATRQPLPPPHHRRCPRGLRALSHRLLGAGPGQRPGRTKPWPAAPAFDLLLTSTNSMRDNRSSLV